MRNKLIAILFFFSVGVIAQTAPTAPAGKKAKTEQEEIYEQFKETAFIQVENVKTPQELRTISEQIQQNVSDVVLLSRTHTLVFAQKKEEYTKSYKKFHSLEIRIDPSETDNSIFEVGFFYFNWTTNKMDKTLYKKISKYNVINELRFGVFEILLGKEYVKKNKDLLDLQNYERIQEVNRSIQEQKKAQKRKEKLDQKRDLEELEEAKKKKNRAGLKKRKEEKNESKPASPEETELTSDNNLNEVDEIENDQQQSEIDAKKTNSDIEIQKLSNRSSRKKVKKEKKKDEEVTPEEQKSDPPPVVKPTEALPPSIPYKMNLGLFSGFNFEEVESTTNDNKVRSVVNFKSILLGVNLDLTQEKEAPIGYDIIFMFGLPTLQKNIDQTLYKKLYFSFFKKDLFFNGLKLMAGLEYSAVNFINVPSFGATLQLFENNFLWGTAGIGYMRGRHYFEFLGKTAFMGSSSQNVSFSAEGFQVGYKNYINATYDVALQASLIGLDGDFRASYKSILLRVGYNFEQ